MTAHQLRRFPRGPACLLANPDGGSDGGANITPALTIAEELHQLMSDEELIHLHDLVRRYHTHASTCTDQCASVIVQHVHARIDHVWPMVRRFDNPQAYKQFIKRCSMSGDGKVGSTREVEVVSGLPAASSTERLEILDEEQHILSFKIVGGQHRLRNYHSVTTLHESMLEGKPSTIVIESYVVDIPHGNTIDETRVFVDTIVKYNLHSLARKAQHHERRGQGEARHSNETTKETDVL
ncbi:hypothetical protein GOP47_0018494 [Adiantum capillus-veneris]|uniref:Uncharacterized protein n=1 Tax=Adiantum capillus-veneris TaxID=13818 RepID=A0A9D4UDI0_ADICA|nr:hypothetical protein GOP47_0018494 [Adiantum capillus-veneris]